MSPRCFLRKIKQIPAENSLVLIVDKELKAKGIFADNDRHNILRIFDTIPNFLFTTSEAKRDYW